MATYYVDGNTGNDGNDGSTGSPWLTIQHAHDQASSADIIIVRNGTYVEIVDITTASLTFQADTGHSPIIDGEWDGTYPVPSTGVLPGGDRYTDISVMYLAMVRIKADNTVWDGISVKRSSGRGIACAWGTDVDNQENITIKNLSIYDCYNMAIIMDYVDGYTIDNVTSYNNGLQVPDPNNPTGGNWPVNLQNTDSTNGTIKNCTTYENYGEGIGVQQGCTFITVEDCTVYDNNHGNIYVMSCTDITIQRNAVFTTAEWPFSGFQAGIFLANESNFSSYTDTTRIVIKNNICVANRYNFEFRYNGGSNIGGMVDCTIAYNTFVNAQDTDATKKGAGVRIIHSPDTTGTEFYNNVIEQSENANSIITTTVTSGIAFDYNNWSKTPDSKASGGNDIVSDPLLFSPSGGIASGGAFDTTKYELTVNSPAIDAADDVTVPVTDDYYGNARDANPDIGAFEDGSPPTYTATAGFTGTPLSGTSPLSVTFTSSATTDDPAGIDYSYKKKLEPDGVYVEFSTDTNPIEEFTIGTWSIKQDVSTSGGASDSLERVSYITVSEPSSVGPQVPSGWWFNPWWPEGYWLTDWWLEFGEDPEPEAVALGATTPSHEQSVQLSILAFEPLVTGSPLVTDQLGSQLETYQHVITAIGGYDKASITVKDRQLNIEDWINKGLGRHIEVYNPSLAKIWEGFVDVVTINLGGLSVMRGPLMEISNKVAITYSTIDTSITPPAVGARVTSAFSGDTDSQNQYGILETILSTGGIKDDVITSIRDTFLAENKDPKTSQTLTVGGGDISMTLQCSGYYNFLKRYIYNQTLLSGDDDLSDVLIAILAADPNSLISTNVSNISQNTLQVKQYIDGDSNAWKLIQGLIARGDTNDNRYTFQILNDRMATYAAVPTDVSYQQRLSDPSQRVETLSGIEVKPWDVRAAKWMFIPDFLIGKTQPSNLRLDPRMIFIESVSYSMPWGLTIQGGTVDKLSQKLAKLGLGGIGGGTS